MLVFAYSVRNGYNTKPIIYFSFTVLDETYDDFTALQAEKLIRVFENIIVLVVKINVNKAVENVNENNGSPNDKPKKAEFEKIIKKKNQIIIEKNN
jgi:hypothetical protein